MSREGAWHEVKELLGCRQGLRRAGSMGSGADGTGGVRLCVGHS